MTRTIFCLIFIPLVEQENKIYFTVDFTIAMMSWADLENTASILATVALSIKFARISMRYKT